MENQDVPPPSEQAPSGVAFAAVGRATGLALRVSAAALGAVGERLQRLGAERTAAARGLAPEDSARPADLVDQVGHAAIGAGAAVAGRVVDAASAAATGLARAAEAFLRQPLVRGSADRLTTATGAWQERGREALDVDARAAADAGLDLAGEIASGVIERLDLNEIIARVDLNEAVSRLDVNAIVDRLDVDRIVRRLDLTRIAQSVIDELDIAAIAQRVIDQLDLAAIAQRVIDELDLTEIARRVIDELELTELIRESTTTVSVDTVDAIRVGGMTADRALARLVGRLLMRKNGSAPDGDGRPSDPATS